MENASKALIIAGAILLAILIISLGLIVYNQAKETVGSVNLSQQEIEAFNAKFTSFQGDNVSGSKVNSLIQTVIASNQQAINDSTGAYVAIQIPSESGGCVTMSVYKGKNIRYSQNGVSDESWQWRTHSSLLDATKSDSDYFGGSSNYSTTKSLSVIKGKTYKVTCLYENGRVRAIDIDDGTRP